MLAGKRDIEGLITIEPQTNLFTWNYTGQNAVKNLNSGYKIYYTTNGKDPDDKSTEFKTPFKFENGELKAVAYLNGEKGPVYNERFGHIKKNWKLVENDVIDLGKQLLIKGFAYTPQQRRDGRNFMEEGLFQISNDGKTWKDVESFRFGNLVNDPTKRYHYFSKPATARYIRIDTTKIADAENIVSIAELDLF